MSKVTTKDNVRLSYVNLLEPRAQNQEKPNELTYSSAILIPKSNTALVAEIQEAIKSALEEGIVKKFGGRTPNGLKNPLRDGDTDRPDDPNYAGHYFINAKGPRGGKEKPVLLDQSRGGVETTDPNVIYSGVHARVSLQFYAYDRNGNRGIAAGISAVLSTGTGDPLANQVTPNSARDEFGIETVASSAASDFASAEAPAASAAPVIPDNPWDN